MSEKAECPRCDAYVSEVYYDQCHKFCGWNCDVEWVVSAFGSVGHARLDTNVKPPQTIRDSVAELAGSTEVSISVTVDGHEPDGPLSAWLDLDKETPPLISGHARRQQARAQKKARLMAEAERRIDEELGEP